METLIKVETDVSALEFVFNPLTLDGLDHAAKVVAQNPTKCLVDVRCERSASEFLTRKDRSPQIDRSTASAEWVAVD